MHSSPEAFAHRVAELIDRLARLTRELQFVHGLNPAQWEALRFLARANRYSRSPGALAEFLGTTKGTASQTLIALENKGYIARARSDTDRRAMHLELTPEGQALLAQDPILTIEQAAGRLSGEVGNPLVQGLSRLLHDLQHKNGIKEFGVCGDCTLLCVKGQAAAPDESSQCGLTGDSLSTEDVARLCVNFQRHDA
ncbi:MAG TPA: MarR family transcriptional regulator [Candidatus Sulfotelmatobacter sp.]|nr:MarR family transcriptional regulator [Candidatus Sulfotelmatobacter sp.]